tara:strand:+ start:602 stop:2041 length:1440 start_codon:yes stop_codon:yes gene_type:complete
MVHWPWSMDWHDMVHWPWSTRRNAPAIVQPTCNGRRSPSDVIWASMQLPQPNESRLCTEVDPPPAIAPLFATMETSSSCTSAASSQSPRQGTATCLEEAACAFAPAEARFSRQRPLPLTVRHFATNEFNATRVFSWKKPHSIKASSAERNRVLAAENAEAYVQLQRGPLASCSTMCDVPGTTAAVTLRIHFNIYHLLRDNVMPILYALYAANLQVDSAATTGSVSNRLDRILLLNSNAPTGAINADWRMVPPYFRVLSHAPLWVLPDTARGGPLPCWRFARLVVGMVPTSDTTQGKKCSMYTVMRRVLLAGLRVQPCMGGAARARLTLVVRTKVSPQPGKQGRQINNLAQILAALGKQRPLAAVSTAAFEELPLHKQWEVCSRTDVLVGVHGAGLGNAIFLPRTSTFIEIFPQVRAGANSLRGMYASNVPKQNYFQLQDLSGCCGFGYNLTLNVSDVLQIVHHAKAQWQVNRRLTHRGS